MIAALPVLALPVLPAPASSAAGPVMPTDEVFALLVARAAPAAAFALPAPTGGHNAALLLSPCPMTDDDTGIAEPGIDQETPPPTPAALNPLVIGPIFDSVVLGAPMSHPVSGRTADALPRRLTPTAGETADLQKPRADTAVALFLVPTPSPAASGAVTPGQAAVDPPPAMPTASQPSALDRRMQLAPGDAALDAIAQDIAASAAPTGRARFAVTAETLGHVDVDVARAASGIAVHFATGSRMATEALLTAQTLLVDSAGAHGIRLAEVQVSTGGPGTDGQHGSQWTGQRPATALPQRIETAAPAPPRTPTSMRARHAGRFA